MKRPIIAGNWKMYKTLSEGQSFVENIVNLTLDIDEVQVIFCPPFPTLFHIVEILKNSSFKVGSQNCHWEIEGAFTGETSPKMLANLGVDFVLLGHSERRHIFIESDEWINKKVHAAMSLGLSTILCIGETLQKRENGLTEIVLTEQLQKGLMGVDKPEKLIVAYEPVWAIGTGVVAEGKQIEEAHDLISNWLKNKFKKNEVIDIPVLYGGSVNLKNVEDLVRIPGVDGFLIGGASLKEESFSGIIHKVEKYYKGL
jgi:triosephosphate isomerase